VPGSFGIEIPEDNVKEGEWKAWQIEICGPPGGKDEVGVLSGRPGGVDHVLPMQQVLGGVRVKRVVFEKETKLYSSQPAQR
jgi:hypothetical protein